MRGQQSCSVPGPGLGMWTERGQVTPHLQSHGGLQTPRPPGTAPRGLDEARASLLSPLLGAGGQACRPPPARAEAGPGRADWPVPAELALQELCAEAAESAELDELWASLLAFITLFLLCVSYGAAVSLLKVGARGPPARAREARGGSAPGRAVLTCPPPR